MTQTVIAVREARDVLAYIPYRLGFRPRDSLVVLCLRGPRRRLGMVLRFDLPVGGRMLQDTDQLADCVAAHATGDGAQRVVLAVYHDGDASQVAALLRRLSRALDRRGTSAVDAWHVGQGRWRSPLCRDAGCCPPQGRPISDLDASFLGAEMVARGAGVEPDRGALLAGLEPAAATVVARVEALRRQVAPAPGVPLGVAARRLVLHRWQRALHRALDAELARDGRHRPAATDADPDAGGDPPDARPAPPGGRPHERCTTPRSAGAGVDELEDRFWAEIVAGLDDVALRDALMLTAVPGGAAAAEALASRRAGARVPPGVRAVLDAVFGAPDEPPGAGAGGRPPAARPDRDGRRPGLTSQGAPPAAAAVPDPALSRAVSALLTGVVRRASPGHRAPALALLGWLAWFDGDGARARLLCERAQQDRPGYALADLVARTLDRAVPPAWVWASRAADLVADVATGPATAPATQRGPEPAD